MILSWRLVPSNNKYDPFSGEGAEKFGGRWNFKGTKLIYCSESRSLAMLEILANLSGLNKNRLYFAYPIQFHEEDCLVLDPKNLPKHWNNHSPMEETKEIGSLWAKNRQSIVLKVPSVIVPVESNYLLNPDHPNFKNKIILGKKSDRSTLLLDPRLI